MPIVSRRSFVAQSRSLFIFVLSITIANLYFQKSVIDLISGKNIEGDILVFLATELVLVFCTYVVYKSYQQSKLLLTSSKSKTMTVTQEKSIHSGSPTYSGGNDCGE